MFFESLAWYIKWRMKDHPGSVLKNSSHKVNKSKLPTLLVGSLVVLLGIGTGWLLAGNKPGTAKSQNNTVTTKNTVSDEDEAGVSDVSAFKNSESPIGILQDGGTENGEGNYHLERPGGKSQTVYLTSTVINLSRFVGKKVQVWGETLSAQKAGWLMDVGKIKVVK